MVHWQVVAASVCGTSHVKNEQLCQDAHHWQVLPDNILVAAVADGAGSAKLGKVGSMVATTAAVESISTYEVSRRALLSDDFVRSLLTSAMVAAKKAIEEEAEATSSSYEDLATTLIVMVATPEGVAVAQIGDGVAVARDYQGNLLALTMPDSGEYINETTFLTSFDSIDNAQLRLWRQPIVNVGVLTDGLQMLAINMAVGAPHKPFFFPLFEFVANIDDRSLAKEQLVKFLRSERITQRTDDDLTLVLAVLQE